MNYLLDYLQIRNHTPENQIIIKENLCIGHFETYKGNVLLAPIASLCATPYDFLVKRGLIKQTALDMNIVYAKADPEFRAWVLSAGFEPYLHDLIISTIATKENRTLSNMCKRYALLEYFDFLISNNKQLKELLK